MGHLPINSALSLANALNNAYTPPTSTLGLASGLLNAPANPAWSAMSLANVATPLETPPWIYLTKRFETFLSNLELTSLQIDDGWKKVHGVVSCLNAAYYGNASQTGNAFLIGSWAKNTHVRPPRDVDLYFILPIEVYHRYERYANGVNKQSALLQEVKSKLVESNPLSDIRGDGPVVLAAFTTYNVEIVPAFIYDSQERSYYVCDTKNGGAYKKTMPLHEADFLSAADARNSNNVSNLVRMLKAWQAWCAVPIPSFCLELLAIEFMDQCEWRNNGYFYYDWITRDFFRWVVAKANTYVWAPGTNEPLWLGDAWKSRAETAYARAYKACEYERLNQMANAGDEWQKIYGTNIPKWV